MDKKANLQNLLSFSQVVGPGAAIGAGTGALAADEESKAHGAAMGGLGGGAFALPGAVAGLGASIAGRSAWDRYRKVPKQIRQGKDMLTAGTLLGALGGYVGSSALGGYLGGRGTRATGKDSMSAPEETPMNKNANLTEKLSYELGSQAALEKIGFLGAAWNATKALGGNIAGAGRAAGQGWGGTMARAGGKAGKDVATGGGLGGAIQGGARHMGNLAAKNPMQAAGVMGAGAAGVGAMGAGVGALASR